MNATVKLDASCAQPAVITPKCSKHKFKLGCSVHTVCGAASFIQNPPWLVWHTNQSFKRWRSINFWTPQPSLVDERGNLDGIKEREKEEKKKKANGSIVEHVPLTELIVGFGYLRHTCTFVDHQTSCYDLTDG